MRTGPIGVFDSGYGGLTVLKAITKKLPGYSYLYLGDNARTPYGTRSFETVYQYTLECVKWFFKQGCPLVVLACNTASAKALRTIQEQDLPNLNSTNRVLGVIRPTAEVIGNYSNTNKIGILATSGTVNSESYLIEINKFYPECTVYQEACPMWVPLIENNEYQTPGAEYFVEKNIRNLFTQCADIDTLLLACTHYPLIIESIKKFAPPGTTILSQGEIVADSLSDYLQRHPEIESRLLKERGLTFFTTDSTEDFDKKGALFFGESIQSSHTDLQH